MDPRDLEHSSSSLLFCTRVGYTRLSMILYILQYSSGLCNFRFPLSVSPPFSQSPPTKHLLAINATFFISLMNCISFLFSPTHYNTLALLTQLVLSILLQILECFQPFFNLYSGSPSFCPLESYTRNKTLSKPFPLIVIHFAI